MIRKAARLTVLFILLIAAAELLLRFVAGLGNPLIFENAGEIGYRVTPSQSIFTLGKRIMINRQGLRNGIVEEIPADGTIRILCVGDSITFGGLWTDQSMTYPNILQNMLNSTRGPRYEVLNASSPGWSIQNMEAFIRRYGIFNSKIVVLQFTNFDLFESKYNAKVGRSIDYPDHKPLLAIQELIVKSAARKSRPRISDKDIQKKVDAHKLPMEKNFGNNLAGIERINSMVKGSGGSLMVILSEECSGYELENPLYIKSKGLLSEKLLMLNVPYINLGEEFRRSGNKILFRDNVHPNLSGNEVIARSVKNAISDLLEKR